MSRVTLCQMELMWSHTGTEECPGQAIVHMQFATGMRKAVCFDCLKLLLDRPPVTPDGVEVPLVSWHDLEPSCVTHGAVWRDTACATRGGAA